MNRFLLDRIPFFLDCVVRGIPGSLPVLLALDANIFLLEPFRGCSMKISSFQQGQSSIKVPENTGNANGPQSELRSFAGSTGLQVISQSATAAVIWVARFATARNRPTRAGYQIDAQTFAMEAKR